MSCEWYCIYSSISVCFSDESWPCSSKEVERCWLRWLRLWWWPLTVPTSKRQGFRSLIWPIMQWYSKFSSFRIVLYGSITRHTEWTSTWSWKCECRMRVSPEKQSMQTHVDGWVDANKWPREHRVCTKFATHRRVAETSGSYLQSSSAEPQRKRRSPVLCLLHDL